MFFTKSARIAFENLFSQKLSESVVEERKFFFTRFQELEAKLDLLEKKHNLLRHRVDYLTKIHDALDARVNSLSKKPTPRKKK